MANYNSIRRGIVPKASDREIHDLMWCCSPYPMVSDLRRIRRSIRKQLKAGGGTVGGAIQHAYAELDREFEAHRARQGAQQ